MDSDQGTNNSSPGEEADISSSGDNNANRGNRLSPRDDEQLHAYLDAGRERLEQEYRIMERQVAQRTGRPPEPLPAYMRDCMEGIVHELLRMENEEMNGAPRAPEPIPAYNRDTTDEVMEAMLNLEFRRSSPTDIEVEQELQRLRIEIENSMMHMDVVLNFLRRTLDPTYDADLRYIMTLLQSLRYTLGQQPRR